MPRINVILMDNHLGIKGSVNQNRDGSFTIIIDAGLNKEQQEEVYLHELHHIIDNDFYINDNASKIEAFDHNFKKGML